MILKKINNFITNDKFLLFIIFLVSFLLNKNYANIGVFPIDTFYHFDAGFRVLNGEYLGMGPVTNQFQDHLSAFFNRQVV